MIDFVLPQKWLDPRKQEHLLLVANRIAAIRYGDVHQQFPAEMTDDGKMRICPHTNDHWLIPPTTNIGQPKRHWRLVGRYDSDEDLQMIVALLKRFL